MPMRSAIHYAWRRAITTWAVTVGGVIALWILISIAEIAQVMFFPILSDQAVFASRHGDEIRFTIVVTKRWPCRPVDVRWALVRDTGDGSIDRIPIAVKRDDGSEIGTIVHPVGRVETGPFVARLPAGWGTASRIEGEIDYSCTGVPWPVHQPYGPVLIPPA